MAGGQIEREIAVTIRRLDDIVYGLYGITETERKIIKVSDLNEHGKKLTPYDEHR